MSTEATHDMGDDFHLFTTFRLDRALVSDNAHTAICGGIKTDIYLLPYHLDRLNAAAEAFTGFRLPEALSNLERFEDEIHHELRNSISEEAINQSNSSDQAKTSVVRRGKVSWWPSGRLETTLLPVGQTFPTLLPQSFDTCAAPTWTVILDGVATDISLYTEVKTSNRAVYDRARQGAMLNPTSSTEVLLYNHDGEVIDGSITTVYFYRDNKWVTPQSGSLKGVTRRYALENKLCSIANPVIKTDSLRDGETVWLSNAFRGFFTATFCTR